MGSKRLVGLTLRQGCGSVGRQAGFCAVVEENGVRPLPSAAPVFGSYIVVLVKRKSPARRPAVGRVNLSVCPRWSLIRKKSPNIKSLFLRIGPPKLKPS